MVLALFILVPLMLLFFFVSFGAFDAAGGVSAIKDSRSKFLKALLSPLTIKRPGIYDFEARYLFFPALLAYFLICVSGVSQLMIRDRASQILSTTYAALTVSVMAVALVSYV